jgi:hypothetical protein
MRADNEQTSTPEMCSLDADTRNEDPPAPPHSPDQAHEQSTLAYMPPGSKSIGERK